MPRKSVDVVQYGSDEHIDALRRAYGIRPEIARIVVKEFEDGTKDWDVLFYEKCKRLVALLDNPEPKAVSPREGWKRDRSY